MACSNRTTKTLHELLLVQRACCLCLKSGT